MLSNKAISAGHNDVLHFHYRAPGYLATHMRAHVGRSKSGLLMVGNADFISGSNKMREDLSGNRHYGEGRVGKFTRVLPHALPSFRLGD